MKKTYREREIMPVICSVRWPMLYTQVNILILLWPSHLVYHPPTFPVAWKNVGFHIHKGTWLLHETELQLFKFWVGLLLAKFQPQKHFVLWAAKCSSHPEPGALLDPLLTLFSTQHRSRSPTMVPAGIWWDSGGVCPLGKGPFPDLETEHPYPD